MRPRGLQNKGRAVFLAVALMAAVTGLAVPVTAGAGEGRAFTGTAVAQGLRTTVMAPRFLVAETLADTGGPMSQAQLTAFGGKSYASSLYPGDTAVFDQIAAVLGLPPPPPYPLQVTATHPSQPKAQADPAGQVMAAEAGPDGAAGRAALGASFSLSTVDVGDDGSVVARAESVVEGAAFPGDLHLGRVHSVVTATLPPGSSTPTVKAVTTVTGASVGGTAVTLGPDGVTAPQPVGLPAGATGPVDEALAEAGTSVRRLKDEPVAGGASADVIEVRTRLATPGLPEAIVIYRLGGATASVLAGALPRLGEFGGAPGGGPADTTTPTEPVGAGVFPVAAPAAPVPGVLAFGRPAPSVGNGWGAGRIPSPAGASAGGIPTEGAPGIPPATDAGDTARETAAPAAEAAAFDAGSVADLRDELGLLYLVLILGGVAAFAAGSILRRKGVQRIWSS